MKIANSIRKAVYDLEQGERESAMLHACNAVDGTAKKIYPLLGNKGRFTRFLRENYSILGPMAAPGHDLHQTYYPVRVKHPGTPGGKADMAEIIYGIHRCCHAHGDELPDGYSLIPDVGNNSKFVFTRTAVAQGQIRLSDRVIPGLVAVVVLSPANKKQAHAQLNGYFLTYTGASNNTKKFIINQWWGRARDFAAIVAQDPVFDLGALDLTVLGSDRPPHNISLDRGPENDLIEFLGSLGQRED